MKISGLLTKVMTNSAALAGRPDKEINDLSSSEFISSIYCDLTPEWLEKKK